MIDRELADMLTCPTYKTPSLTVSGEHTTVCVLTFAYLGNVKRTSRPSLHTVSAVGRRGKSLRRIAHKGLADRF